MNETRPKSTWLIRPVGQAEVSQVLDVYRQCEDFLALGPQPAASMGMVLDDMRHSREEGGIYCGIFHRSELGPERMIGIVDYVPAGFGGVPGHAFLSLLMIAASHRSHGIGGQVVHFVEEIIRRNPEIRSIFCGVQINNPAAQRFWERQGYSILSGPEVLPDTTVVYLLRKDLEPHFLR